MMPVKETSCQSKPKTSYSNAHAPVSRSSKIDIGFFSSATFVSIKSILELTSNSAEETQNQSPAEGMYQI